MSYLLKWWIYCAGFIRDIALKKIFIFLLFGFPFFTSASCKDPFLTEDDSNKQDNTIQFDSADKEKIEEVLQSLTDIRKKLEEMRATWPGPVQQVIRNLGGVIMDLHDHIGEQNSSASENQNPIQSGLLQAASQIKGPIDVNNKLHTVQWKIVEMYNFYILFLNQTIGELYEMEKDMEHYAGEGSRKEREALQKFKEQHKKVLTSLGIWKEDNTL